MESWTDRVPPLREEAHYGRPPMRCFAARPASLVEMLEGALARNPGGEALVCGDTRLTWRQLGERIAQAAGAFAAWVKGGEEETVAILYTSGTTGRPKGAMLTNLGIVHSSMVFEACMGLDATTRALAAVPLSRRGRSAATAARRCPRRRSGRSRRSCRTCGS